MLYEDDPEGPPCGECLPKILPENEDVVRVFLRCKTQVIAGAGGIIDINHLAVEMWMARLGVSDHIICQEGVDAMYQAYHKALEDKYKNAKPED